MKLEQLVPLIRAAAHDVFETMLGLPLEDREARTETASPNSVEGVVALVGLAGAWAGSGTFACSAETARQISGAFLMQEFHAVDDEVLDAIGEIANMILGNVKSAIEERLGPMGLSIPTVIYGRNFTTRSIGNSPWTIVAFTSNGQRIEVHLCLAPNKQPSTARLTPAMSVAE